MFLPETIHQAVDAAVETKIASKAMRDALMLGIDSAVVASIPEHPSPRIQTLYDLVALARMPTALRRWLKNALYVVLPGASGREVFEQLLDQLETGGVEVRPP